MNRDDYYKNGQPSATKKFFDDTINNINNLEGKNIEFNVLDNGNNTYPVIFVTGVSPFYANEGVYELIYRITNVNVGGGAFGGGVMIFTINGSGLVRVIYEQHVGGTGARLQAGTAPNDNRIVCINTNGAGQNRYFQGGARRIR